MLMDDAKLLADKLRASEEYTAYRDAKERAYASETTAKLDPAAAAYLMAEYRLNALLGEIYKLLAKAVDLDLGALEA